ncbi:RpiB/LacA/LacB family sugar-phosphate isomerase [Arthrobacter sp. NPDC058097]|uniref:RpiB/LacA/LacB family sugar-phosphate isomerase n=1 Tax=Arthrobacter sp. NPDC058097 TaxID=3346340 RepID=UPI0036DBE6F5
MRIHLSADHAGFQLAQNLLVELRRLGHDVNYYGAPEFDDGDDYPKFTVAAGQAVIADEDLGRTSLGIIVGATGVGEQITANKVKGIRAVVGWDAASLKEARNHNDANVLTLGARTKTVTDALSLTEVFLAEKFEFGEADVRRILHTAEFENSGTIEGWMIDASAESTPA